MNIVSILYLSFYLALTLVGLSPFLSLSLVFYAITFFFYFTTHFIDACHVHLTPQRAYPAYFLSLRSSFPDCMVLVSGGFYDLR